MTLESGGDVVSLRWPWEKEGIETGRLVVAGDTRIPLLVLASGDFHINLRMVIRGAVRG